MSRVEKLQKNKKQNHYLGVSKVRSQCKSLPPPQIRDRQIEGNPRHILWGIPGLHRKSWTVIDELLEWGTLRAEISYSYPSASGLKLLWVFTSGRGIWFSQWMLEKLHPCIQRGRKELIWKMPHHFVLKVCPKEKLTGVKPAGLLPVYWPGGRGIPITSTC